MKHSFYHLITLVFATIFLIQCDSSTESSDYSSFVATLGKDTMVIERIKMMQNEVHAEVLIRTPRTRYSKQHLITGDDDNFISYISETYDPSDLEGDAILVTKMEIEGDSLVIRNKRDTSEQISKIKYDPSIVPWIDMVHWPYQLVTERMVASQEKKADQNMLAGRRARIFEFRSVGEDSVSIKHPSRGTMMARIDGNGAILTHDATQTTRKLIVKRGVDLDIKSLAEYYADKPIGSLSGAGSSESTVHGATIKLTFGQPARRGRELFGGIVPWNERWRTGANRATHITTDKDLKIGDLDMPAGEYTLFTIPAPDGGTLIINKQTGQNGRSYDEARDLGRVPMKLVENSESIELFTIDAIERGEDGVLQLKWGETIFEVEFQVGG
ncbi:MAG: DUF2911 domain-containing protein [Saprospiraceae bacterium]|nr:DUF2911 domain-containing protein [Saprospiraceae bacterium]